MDDEISFSEYFLIIRKNIWLIAALFILIFGAAALYTFTTDPIYQARSLVVVNAPEQTLAYLTQQRAADVQTQAQIMMSASVVGEVYIEKKNFDPGHDVTITPVKETNIIEILVANKDKGVAMDIANKIAEKYVAYNLNSRKETASTTSSFISEQITAYQKELEALNKKEFEMRVGVPGIEKRNMTEAEQFQYDSILKEIEVKTDIYNYLLTRKEEVGILAKENAGTAKIVERATIPTVPIKPNKLMNLALGIIIGLLVSLGVAFIKEFYTDAFLSVSDVEKSFGPVVMGTLPRLKSDERHAFYTAHGHKSSFSEDIRVLRTNLMFYLKDKNIKLVTVTSPQKGEGKSTVVANLAMSMAKNGSRVLLVDGNLRNPSLNKFFGEKELTKKGLSDLILGTETLDRVIRKTGEKSLDVIYSGSYNKYPSELLSSNRMVEICKKLKAMDYDMVLFTSASLQFAEGSLLMSMTDGAIIVVLLDKTSKESAEKAKKTLKKAHANLIGRGRERAKMRRLIFFITSFFLFNIILLYLAFRQMSVGASMSLSSGGYLEHFTAFFALTLLLYLVLNHGRVRGKVPYPLLVCFAYSMLVGIGVEIIQGMLGYRTFDYIDIVFDLLGSLAFVWIASTSFGKGLVEKAY